MSQKINCNLKENRGKRVCINKRKSMIQQHSEQSGMGLFQKFFISAMIDILDFFIPAPIDTFFDIITVPIAVKLWGNAGYLEILEAVEVSGLVDMFIPTTTIIGIYTQLTK